MNVILSCYKDKINIPKEFKPETTIGEIKEQLKQILEERADYKYTFNEINLLYSSQILDDKKTLSSYNIQNNSMIFYYYKKKKSKGKKVDSSTNSINNINDNNKVDNINKKKGSNNNDENYLLTTYSSIMKILVYYDPSNMGKILKYLEQNKKEVFKLIKENRENFESLLKYPINNDDIHFYKENYEKVLDLKNAISDKNNNENNNENNKEKIILNEEDNNFIKTWIFKSKKFKKQLDKETIILEYIKNKFNQNETSNKLMEILYAQ